MTSSTPDIQLDVRLDTTQSLEPEWGLLVSEAMVQPPSPVHPVVPLSNPGLETRLDEVLFVSEKSS